MRSLEKEARLISTNTAENRGGRANVKIIDTEQILQVEAVGLTPDWAFGIFVDGRFWGLTLPIQDFCGSNFPTNLLPLTNIRLVELRTLRGEAVLRGQFSAISGAVAAPGDK